MLVWDHTASLSVVLRSRRPGLGEHVDGLGAVSEPCVHTEGGRQVCQQPQPLLLMQNHRSDIGANAEHTPSLSGGTQQHKACFISFCMSTKRQRIIAHGTFFFFFSEQEEQMGYRESTQLFCYPWVITDVCFFSEQNHLEL